MTRYDDVIAVNDFKLHNLFEAKFNQGTRSKIRIEIIRIR